MTPLGRKLAERIGRDGPLPVAEFMQICLADPEHGYYRRADAIGRGGDFVTSPEISQMFGELIGLWAAEIWITAGRPASLRLAELGPGRGTLMTDALRAIGRTLPDFLSAIDLHLIEINPQLRARQAKALASAKPSWHDSIAVVPQGPAIFIANEFFDALPVQQFERAEGVWHERCVAFDMARDSFVFTRGDAVSDPPFEPAQRDAPEGAIVEVSPARRALATTIAKRIATQGGAALIIDYGAMASGTGDTLQAVRRHATIGPLAAPGESDLTTHVDFASLARAALTAGADVHGPLPQGIFLQRLGIAARAAILLRTATPSQKRDIVAACERLIGETQMGILFKALAITARGASSPPGFDPIPKQPDPR